MVGHLPLAAADRDGAGGPYAGPGVARGSHKIGGSHESTIFRSYHQRLLMVPARNAWTPWVSPVQDQDAIRSAAHVVSGTETYLGFGRIASEKTTKISK